MASYEEIFGKATARSIKRNAGIPVKKKPAPKPAPKAKAPAPKPRVSAPRPVVNRRPLGPAVPKNVADRNRADYELRKINAQYLAKPSGKPADNPLRPGTKIAGIDPSRLRGPGGSLFGDIIANFAGDVVDTATGLPTTARLGAENLAALNALPFAAASRAGVPGLGGAERYVRRVANLDKQAGKATIADYKYRYGDLAKVNIKDVITGSGDSRENLRKGGGKIAEHPGLFASDVAGVYSAAGAGVRAGAAGAGRVIGNEALQRIGSKSIAPGSRRARLPKVNEVEMGANTALGAKGRSVAKVVTNRRPRSANPITSSVQVQIEKLGQKMARQTPGAKQRRFNRAVSTQARDYRLDAELSQTKKLRQGAAPYVKAVKALDDAGSRSLKAGGKAKWTRDQVDAALFLHGRDLLDVPGMTPELARQSVLKYMREGADKMVKESGVKNTGAQATMDKIASVPKELLDLKNGPPELRAAVAEYRKLSQAATEGRVAAGTITPETAKAVTQRSAQAVFEGARYDAKSGQWTSPRNPYSPVGSKGVYTQDVPVDQLKNGKSGDASGAFGRMTQDKVKQSHGTLFSTGNVSVDRGLPIKALERSLVDQAHPQFVKDFYKTFAFQRPDGKLSRGRRAIMAMEADPDNVVLMSRKSLDDAMRMVRDLPEGEVPDNPLRAVEMYEGKDGLALVRNRPVVPGERGDLVAFPKAAVEGMREGWDKVLGPKGKTLKGYDTVLSMWKRGVLSFAPRYYVNSLLGNSLAYGMMTGYDIRSLRQASRKRLGESVPERINSSTNVNEARLHDVARKNLTKPTAAFGRFSDRLMGFQSSFDALFRRAAYINRTKKGLRAEGVKTRGLSPDDLGEAIRTAPKEVVDQAIRETEMFFGDYLRLGPTERGTLRRVFPFYSFMRYAGRLLLEMPIRHPKRTALVAAMTQASTDVLNDLDPYQDNLANRGRVIAGGFAARTAGPNTFFPLADSIRAAAGGDWKGLAGTVADNATPVLAQQLLRTYSGQGAFGAPISAPPGYNGSFQNYGGPMMRTDPVTGTATYYEPSVPLVEQLLQTVPLVPQLARGIASGGRQPYDTTTTLDLISRSKPDKELFKPKRDRAMEPIPYLAPLLGWAGANVQRYDRYMEEQELRKRQQLAEKAKRSTAKRKRKAR